MRRWHRAKAGAAQAKASGLCGTVLDIDNIRYSKIGALMELAPAEAAMLPNGFYKDLQDIGADEVAFVCYGIPRSGTTFVFQLICGICPEGVAKTHRYCSHPVKTLVSYRDFRDVAVSMWRKSNPKNRRRRMTSAEVDAFAQQCLKRVAVLDRYFDRGGICPLQYEKFVDNAGVVFSAIESAFGIVAPPEKIAALGRKYSLKENRRISKRLHGFKQYDARTQIHGNHIYRGEIGGWREFVDDRGAERLERMLQASLVRYGYQLSSAGSPARWWRKVLSIS